MRTRTPQTKKPAVQAVESTVRVTRKVCGQESEEVTSEVHKFEVEPAYVRVNGGITKSTGNYESLRVDVSISVPCYVEDIQATYDRIADDVAFKLEDEVEKYMGPKTNGKK